MKHYIELFITRIIEYYPSEFVSLLLKKLRGDNTLVHTITYVIMAGLVLKKRFNAELYNTLMALTCHNTAYLRGLAQYFCFWEFWKFEEQIPKQSLIRRLQDQFRSNPDSIKLSQKIHVLITNYEKQLQYCNLDHLLTVPIYKAGEIV